MGDYGDELPKGMTSRDIEILADVLSEKVMHRIEERGVPSDIHRTHHEWAEQKMAAEKDAAGSRQRIIEKIVGTAGAVGLVGLVTWIGHSIIQAVAQAAGRIWP